MAKSPRASPNSRRLLRVVAFVSPLTATAVFGVVATMSSSQSSDSDVRSPQDSTGACVLLWGRCGRRRCHRRTDHRGPRCAGWRRHGLHWCLVIGLGICNRHHRRCPQSRRDWPRSSSVPPVRKGANSPRLLFLYFDQHHPWNNGEFGRGCNAVPNIIPLPPATVNVEACWPGAHDWFLAPRSRLRPRGPSAQR